MRYNGCWGITLSKIRLGAVAALFIAPLLLSIGFCVFIYKTSSCPSYQPPEASLDKISTVVVFSGTSKRLYTSLHFLAKNPINYLFISGVNQCVHPKYLISFFKKNKKNKTTVNLGYKAQNTLENALETRDWLLKNNISSFYLVTSYYHMPRSLQLMKAALPHSTIIPLPVHPSKKPATFHAWIKKIQLLFFEYVKYLGSFMQIIQIRCFL